MIYLLYTWFSLGVWTLIFSILFSIMFKPENKKEKFITFCLYIVSIVFPPLIWLLAIEANCEDKEDFAKTIKSILLPPYIIILIIEKRKNDLVRDILE